MAPTVTHPLADGVHTFEVDGCELSYHVHGTGPVCVAHPGGPGIRWDYLRSLELEQHLTMVYLEPAGTGRSGRLPSHPHGYTRARYSRHLAALIDQLGGPQVHLLGHSHGGFVAQYHALHRPDQLAGVVLYESAPATGPEFDAEAVRQVAGFAARHAGKPGLELALAAFREVPSISDDESMVRVVRAILPAYVADYWADAGRWALVQSTLAASYVSGLDEHGVPDLFDDRPALGAATVPALVVTGRFDVVCGVRWGEELHKLIPGSRLVVLADSGHLGHLEEPGLFTAAVAEFVATHD
jgi:pimeloyl-ACP methyl ester carboxylesterase